MGKSEFHRRSAGSPDPRRQQWNRRRNTQPNESPEGTTENSPAFQRWVGVPQFYRVPKGRQKMSFEEPNSLSPAELGRLGSRKNFVSAKNGTARFTPQTQCALSLSRKRARLLW